MRLLGWCMIFWYEQNKYICSKRCRIHALPLPSRRYTFLIFFFLSRCVLDSQFIWNPNAQHQNYFSFKSKGIHSLLFFSGFNMLSFSFTFFSHSLTYAFDHSFRYCWFAFFSISHFHESWIQTKHNYLCEYFGVNITFLFKVYMKHFNMATQITQGRYNGTGFMYVWSGVWIAADFQKMNTNI